MLRPIYAFRTEDERLDFALDLSMQTYEHEFYRDPAVAPPPSANVLGQAPSSAPRLLTHGEWMGTRDAADAANVADAAWEAATYSTLTAEAKRQGTTVPAESVATPTRSPAQPSPKKRMPTPRSSLDGTAAATLEKLELSVDMRSAAPHAALSAALAQHRDARPTRDSEPTQVQYGNFDYAFHFGHFPYVVLNYMPPHRAPCGMLCKCSCWLDADWCTDGVSKIGLQAPCSEIVTGTSTAVADLHGAESVDASTRPGARSARRRLLTAHRPSPRPKQQRDVSRLRRSDILGGDTVRQLRHHFDHVSGISQRYATPHSRRVM